MTNIWRAAWKDDAPPRLALTTDSAGELGVLDTRLGPRQWLPVGLDAAAMLRRLTSPVRADKLASDLGIPVEQVQALLADFTDRKFLFEESGTVISLVTVEAEAGGEMDHELSDARPELPRVLLRLAPARSSRP